jgi:hypothetical protein
VLDRVRNLGRLGARSGRGTVASRRLAEKEEWIASARRRMIAGEAPHLEIFFLSHRVGRPKDPETVRIPENGKLGPLETTRSGGPSPGAVGASLRTGLFVPAEHAQGAEGVPPAQPALALVRLDRHPAGVPGLERPPAVAVGLRRD